MLFFSFSFIVNVVKLTFIIPKCHLSTKWCTILQTDTEVIFFYIFMNAKIVNLFINSKMAWQRIWKLDICRQDICTTWNSEFSRAKNQKYNNNVNKRTLNVVQTSCNISEKRKWIMGIRYPMLSFILIIYTDIIWANNFNWYSQSFDYFPQMFALGATKQ